MVNGQKESSRSVEEEMRADSLAVGGVGVASASWGQGASVDGVERARAGEAHPSSLEGPLQLGSFARWPQEGQARSFLCVADPSQQQRSPSLLCPNGSDCPDIGALELCVVGGKWKEGGKQACRRPEETEHLGG